MFDVSDSLPGMMPAMSDKAAGDSLSVELIAHRGYRAAFPENTLTGIRAAIAAGARWVEFDIQLSADGIPVLMHDPTLDRTTGRPGVVCELTLDELRAYAPGEPDRFGDKYADVAIPTLAELCAELTRHPHVTAFAEIKKESIGKFGSRFTVARVLEALQACIGQCVIISFVAEAVAQARQLGAPRIGWAIREFNGIAYKEATILEPQFLFCDYKIIPKASSRNPRPLWKGPWRWAIYEVDDPQLALRLTRQGADLIETFDIAGMLRHPALAPYR